MQLNKKIAIYDDNEAVNQRLNLIGRGLSIDLLKSVAEASIAHASQVTKNNATNGYGTYLYQHLIKTLRDQLKTHGWTKSSVNNRESIISPDLSTSIVVMTATQGVCVNEPPNLPTNKNPKGKKFIEDMVKQFKDSIILPLFEDIPNQKYWVLLHYRNQDKLYLELSRPYLMTANCKYISGYHERIFIGEISLSGKTPNLDKLIENQKINIQQPDIKVARRRA